MLLSVMYPFWLFFVACILHPTSALDTELSERIIGGEFVTDFKKHPYMGFLVKLKKGQVLFYCGASILSPKYILTAAHCVKNCCCGDKVTHQDCDSCKASDTKQLTLYTGSDVFDQHSKYSSYLHRWHIHPEYEQRDKKHKCIYHNDIAVGELKTPLVFSAYINKVQLPMGITKDRINDTSVKTTQWAANNTQCKVFGWGDYIACGKSFLQGRKLKSLQLTLISNELCLKYLYSVQKEISYRFDSLNNFGFCYDSQLCTIDPDHKSNPTFGDSGGPLICEGTQVGIMSRGINRKWVGVNYPFIYTRVDIYVPWINSIIGDK